jgi:gamma-glutamyltranspeptidase/glutathione hydrolase
VSVPIETLLSDAYSRRRREMLRADRAWPEMPPCGEIPGFAHRQVPAPTALRAEAGARDTSYVCVVDKDGNVLSATPSDPSFDTPVIPGTGAAVLAQVRRAGGSGTRRRRAGQSGRASPSPVWRQHRTEARYPSGPLAATCGAGDVAGVP